MAVIDRAAFLNSLQLVAPGLSTKDVVEQSSSVVFDRGVVITFNDEICCRSVSGLDDQVRGAVNGKRLMEVLQERPDELIDWSYLPPHLILRGNTKGRWRAIINMESEVLLPISIIEKPKLWKKLDSSFSDAVNTVASCIGTNKEKFNLTCIHIHPDYLEACDDFQACRWSIPTQVTKSLLVRGKCLKSIVSLGMDELSQTGGWIHLRNEHGVIYSIRSYAVDYKDISSIFAVRGETIQLPKELAESTKRAEIFSRDSPDGNQVVVTLKSGRLLIRGSGEYGTYEEQKKINYSGNELSFMIPPAILSSIATKYNNCILSTDKILVDTGNYKYMSGLVIPNEGIL